MIHYLIGDATDPINRPSILAHICNSVGAWKRGFVMSLSKRNKTPERGYKHWFENYKSGPLPFRLGEIQITSFISGVSVANMIAQEGIRWEGKIPPIRYEALESCLQKLYAYCQESSFTVAMPRIGCVLAGGSWDKIEAIIKKTMTTDTYVYTLESQKDRWPETKYE